MGKRGGGGDFEFGSLEEGKSKKKKITPLVEVQRSFGGYEEGRHIPLGLPILSGCEVGTNHGVYILMICTAGYLILYPFIYGIWRFGGQGRAEGLCDTSSY